MVLSDRCRAGSLLESVYLPRTPTYNTPVGPRLHSPPAIAQKSGAKDRRVAKWLGSGNAKRLPSSGNSATTQYTKGTAIRKFESCLFDCLPTINVDSSTIEYLGLKLNFKQIKMKDNFNVTLEVGLNRLLDFYYALREFKFGLIDNSSSSGDEEGYKKNLIVSLDTVLELPLYSGIEELEAKVRAFFSTGNFYWVDDEGTKHAELNTNLSHGELNPFLFGDCSGLSGCINPLLIGDLTYLHGDINQNLVGRVFPALKGDISNLYGNLGLGVDAQTRLSGVINKDLTGSLSGVKGGVINPQLRGDLSGICGTLHPKLTGDCTGLTGFVTGLKGDCTGLTGRLINFTGDCSNLSGDCTGLEGDCTGLEYDLNNIPWDLRPNRLENFVGIISGVGSDYSPPSTFRVA